MYLSISVVYEIKRFFKSMFKAFTTENKNKNHIYIKMIFFLQVIEDWS